MGDRRAFRFRPACGAPPRARLSPCPPPPCPVLPAPVPAPFPAFPGPGSFTLLTADVATIGSGTVGALTAARAVVREGLEVRGATTLDGPLAVVGPIGAQADLTVGGRLSVAGDTTLSALSAGNTTVRGGLTAEGPAHFEGESSFDGTATYNGAAAYNGELTANGPASFEGTTSFDGATTYNGAATYNGEATFAGPASYSSTATFGGPAAYNGTATYNGAATYNSGAAFGAPLDMQGNRIVDLGTPVAASDAVTKQYADSLAHSGMAAGPATSVQYNDSGMFAGSASLTWTDGDCLSVSGWGTNPRLVVGGPPEPQAAFQMKTDSEGTVQLAAAVAPPPTSPNGVSSASRVVVQSCRDAGSGNFPTALAQVLRLPDQTAAYCDMTITGTGLAGQNPGSVNAYHFRFRARRVDAAGGAVVDGLTKDFEEIDNPANTASIGTSGPDVMVTVQSGDARVRWDVNTVLCVTPSWA